VRGQLSSSRDHEVEELEAGAREREGCNEERSLVREGLRTAPQVEVI